MLIRITFAAAVVLSASILSAEEIAPRAPMSIQPLVAAPVPQPPHPTPLYPVQVTNATTLDASEVGKKQKLLEQKIGEQDELQRQIQQLRRELQTPEQILVRVRMLEVSHTKMRKMGFDVGLLSKGYLTAADSSSLRAAAAKMPADSHAKPVHLSDHNAVSEFADFLVENDFGRALAEPSIVTLADRPAQFNVGGELAIPARDGSTAAVEFRPYGTTMDVLAISKGGNVIRMELRLRVSELDESHPIHVGATRVPSLSVQQIDTSVQTRANESVALCGMAERRVVKNKNTQADKQASGEAETELTELMVVVTPEIVTPLE